MQRGILGGVCALVIGVYAYTAHSGFAVYVSPSLNAGDAYCNLLVKGFQAGQLNLKIDVPPGLAQAADPYDPAVHSRYPVLDMSYYHGKLYLYYGVTPVLVLFWPYAALTGHYLPQKDAAVIFCLVGFLASAAVFWSLWRRHFGQVSVFAVAAGTLGLGLATGLPFLMARCDVYEVCISCGYAFSMLALAAIWQALHEPRQGWWLAAASLAYGLAVAARPSLLFGGVILFVPVVKAWREHRRIWPLLLAAMTPVVLIGLGLMLYNSLRFDQPFEFGWRYALSGDRSSTVRPFSPRWLWFHLRVYFLAVAGWSSRFPFVRDISLSAVPAGHGRMEHPFGVLTNVPLVWLALVPALVSRMVRPLRPERGARERSALGGFVAAVAVLFGTSAIVVSCFFSASFRYEVEFLPALVLLAAVGILSGERALVSCQPHGRGVARCGWGLLLGSRWRSTCWCASSDVRRPTTTWGRRCSRGGGWTRQSYSMRRRCG